MTGKLTLKLEDKRLEFYIHTDGYINIKKILSVIRSYDKSHQVDNQWAIDCINCMITFPRTGISDSFKLSEIIAHEDNKVFTITFEPIFLWMP